METKPRRLNKYDYETIAYALSVAKKHLENEGLNTWVLYREMSELSELFLDKAGLDEDQKELYR
jgi:hypothetical protein